MDDESMQTESVVLSSREVAAGALAKLGLDAGRSTFAPCQFSLWPSWEALSRTRQSRDQLRQSRDQLIDAVLSCVDVSVLKKSFAVSVKVRATDPHLAASMANAFAQSYLDFRLARRAAAYDTVHGALTKQVGTLMKAVNAADGAVEAYRRAHGLYAAQDGSIGAQRLKQLTSALTRADVARHAAGVSLSEAERARREQAAGTLSGIRDSDLMEGLVRQSVAADQHAAEMSAEFGPRHPELRAAQAASAVSTGSATATIDRFVQGIARQSLMAEAQYDALNAQFEALKGQVSEENDESIHLEALERDAKAERSLLQAVLERAGLTDGVGAAVQADARLVSPATPADRAAYPPKTLFVAISALAAGILGCLVALVMEGADRTFRRPEQVQDYLGQPLLGFVPRVADPLWTWRAENRAGRSYRGALERLAQGVLPADASGTATILVVTSAIGGEGKSVMSAGLGHIVARSGRRTLLIDCNRQAATAPRTLREGDPAGLADVLETPHAAVEDCLQRDPGSGLDVMPAGRVTAATFDLLTGAAMRRLLRRLALRYDVILLDCPPVGASADVLALARMAHRVVLVARWGATTREAVAAALRRLSALDVDIAGIAVSRVVQRRLRSYGSHDEWSAGRPVSVSRRLTFSNPFTFSNRLAFANRLAVRLRHHAGV
jgi:uncharacterized protein involved in exopolysaccharide biosynthesis/MinD-like ATPase involved in chromosome partitioning or flagellar assembly